MNPFAERAALRAAVLLLACAAGRGVSAQEATASLGVATDYVSRGVSQSERKPVLQADVEFAAQFGAYAGAFASQVDYTAPGVPSDGVGLELALRAGWRGALGDAWNWEAGVEHMAYPGADGPSPDYTEWSVGVAWRERVQATVTWTPDYYGLGGAATDTTLGVAGTRRAWAWTATLGYHDQHALAGDGYPHAEATASRALGRWTLTAAVAGALRWSPALAEVNGRRALSRPGVRLELWRAYGD